MPSTTASAKKQNTTADQSFFDCTPDSKLFSVRAGVPSASALEHASCFLASALDIANQNEPITEASWGAISLIEMAKAIIDSVAPNLACSQSEGGAA